MNPHSVRSREEMLRQLLARHEAELASRKQLLRDEIAPEPGERTEPLEPSAGNAARDLEAALLEATARTVQALDDALRRVKTGSYGSCIECTGPIPDARLQALPFAERCRGCQEQYDPAAGWTPLFV